MKHRAVMWRPMPTAPLTKAEAAAEIAAQRERAQKELSALQNWLDAVGHLAQSGAARFALPGRYYA